MARFAVFQVALLRPASRNVSVDYETVPGTAIEGEDYTPLSGTLVFAEGEQTKEVRVEVRTTNVMESESFTLRLSNPRRARLEVAEGTATLVGTAAGGLNALFPNRNLQVLFYAGEKHPSTGSDTEWSLAPTQATFVADGSEYAGVIGQLQYNLGGPILIAGGGGIQTESGYWLHYLVQDAPEGGTFQVLFNDTDTILPDQTLLPENVAAFTEWWNAGGVRNLELLNAADEVVASLGLPWPSNDPGYDPDIDGDPSKVRLAFQTSLPWGTATPDGVVKLRVVPAI